MEDAKVPGTRLTAELGDGEGRATRAVSAGMCTQCLSPRYAPTTTENTRPEKLTTNVVYLYTGILLKNKKEQVIFLYYNNG